MSISWIKMSTCLGTHPKVIRISSALHADRLRVIGGLHAVWSLFDMHSEDGLLSGYTADALDELINWPGFSAALVNVGWLLNDGTDGLVLPRFDTHNGASAKRRAQESERKRTVREEKKTSAICPQSARNMSAADADKKRTREEKRREEKNPPIPPKGPVSFKTWIEVVKAKGEKPIQEADPIFAYAEDIGLPDEFLALAWREFRHRYMQSDAKRYRDWRAVFRKAVRGNWFRLWWLDGEQYTLTTAGMQARRSDEKAA